MKIFYLCCYIHEPRIIYKNAFITIKKLKNLNIKTKNDFFNIQFLQKHQAT